MLDVGCGTGTLAITAKGHVGAGGVVCGVDASREMIARAKKKSAKAGAQVEFSQGVIAGSGSTAGIILCDSVQTHAFCPEYLAGSEGTMAHALKRAPDRRVQKTRRLLHEALVSLLHEKNYDAIVVKEVLDRADVGRSTFYTHFRDKDDLLVNGIRDILNSIRTSKVPRLGTWREKLLWFSLPIYEHVDDHRRRNKLKIGLRGRIVLHEQLQRVLVDLISNSMKSELQMRRKEFEPIPAELLIQHLASTFILVLNWSVERKEALDPKQVDAIFHALVSPIFAAD